VLPGVVELITALTALGGRSAEWLFHCYAVWTDDDDARHIGWARATHEALRP